MKLKQTLFSWAALALGLSGTVLCLLAANLGTDYRGLMPTDHPLFILIYVMVIVALFFFFYILQDVKGDLTYRETFPDNYLPLVGCFVGMAGLTVTSVSILMDSTATLATLAGISGLLAALCMGLIGFLHYKKLRPHYLFHGIITIALLLLLIYRYQSWNTQPQLANYFTQLLASVFLMLTMYHRSALDAGMGNRRSYAFFNLGSVFCCCLAAAGGDWLFYMCMGVWCFTNPCSLATVKPLPPMELPEEVLYCLQTLDYYGHSAYVVGGCVRDHLLGLTPSDYDMCTSATPEEICDLFERHQLVRSGEKHGTIGVVVAGQVYEITTFRKEGAYSDVRHPDEVEFVADIREDLARRDFTVNAMAYNPETGYVDPFGGQTDLQKKVLRAVGDPDVRFNEDALRILRGVRFAVRFGLTPTENTLSGMSLCAPLMNQLAKERVSAELCKILPLISANQLIQYKSVFTQLLPALVKDDIYKKTATVVGLTEPVLPLRLAALLHSLDTITAEDILLQLKLSNTLRNRASLLVKLHTQPLPNDKKQLRRILGEHGQEAIEQVLALQIAVAKAAGESIAELESVQLLLGTLREDSGCLTAKDLAITGSDLLALGTEPGPHIGQCMQALLSLVQDEVLANTKEELMEAAKHYFEIEEDV